MSTCTAYTTSSAKNDVQGVKRTTRQAKDDVPLQHPSRGNAEASGTTVLAARTQSADQLVVDHQGPAKLVFQPDGNVVWEVQGDHRSSSSGLPPALTRLGRCLMTLGQFSMVVGGAVGSYTAMRQLDEAYSNGYCLTNKHLTRMVAETVSSSIAGVLTGVAWGPLVAVRQLTGRLLRPGLLVAVPVILGRRLSHVPRTWVSVPNLMRQIQEEEVDEEVRVAAIRKLATQAGRNKSFRRKVFSHGGVEVLVHELSRLRSSEGLVQATSALQRLMADPDCREAVVATGGVPPLVALLDHEDGLVREAALRALTKLGAHSLAQQEIREAGGVKRLLSMLGSVVHGVYQYLVVQLLLHMSVDPVVCQDIHQEGGQNVLLQQLQSPLPQTEVKHQVVAILHNVARSNEAYAKALANTSGAKEKLKVLLAAYGPYWYPSKADAHALLNIISKHETSGSLGASDVGAPPRDTEKGDSVMLSSPGHQGPTEWVELEADE